MNYLSVEQLAKSYGESPLFAEITFGISLGQKVALVGKNGCGKSTLLRIISGVEKPDRGKVVFRNDLKIKYLPQNPEFLNHQTVRDYLFDQHNELLATISAYEDFIQMSDSDFSSDQYQELVNRMDALSAWDYETQIKQILGKLGIYDLDQYADELSGGEKKRVALANTLIEKPDFLILDEPTNHLDVDVIEWLESYLSTQAMSLLLVTHDRYFLEQVTNEIIELDQGQLFSYHGSYSYFLEKKSERMQQKAAEIEKAKNLLRTELDWLNRMPKARSHKAKYRIDSARELQQIASQQIDAQSLTLKTDMTRQGKKVLEIHHLSKSYDDLKIIDDFSYTFKKHDRIGIVGKNGVGKTTLLNLITGALTPEKGEVVLGETIKFGYYHQEEFVPKAGQRVIDVVKEVAEVVKLVDGNIISASQFLQHFLFPPEVQYTLVEKLSGGEKRRLQLMRVLIEMPNFLILDEPTNDLDIYTMNVLENYLMFFRGTLVIVSHDRYFMDKLTDHLFVFKGPGKIVDFPGNYSNYKTSLDAESPSQEPKPKKIEKKPNNRTATSSKQKRSYHEQREYDRLETEIEQLEQEKKELLRKLNSEISDHEKLTEWSSQIAEITELIDEKTERWLELAEMQ